MSLFAVAEAELEEPYMAREVEERGRTAGEEKFFKMESRPTAMVADGAFREKREKKKKLKNKNNGLARWVENGDEEKLEELLLAATRGSVAIETNGDYTRSSHSHTA